MRNELDKLRTNGANEDALDEDLKSVQASLEADRAIEESRKGLKKDSEGDEDYDNLLKSLFESVDESKLTTKSSSTNSTDKKKVAKNESIEKKAKNQQKSDEKQNKSKEGKESEESEEKVDKKSMTKKWKKATTTANTTAMKKNSKEKTTTEGSMKKLSQDLSEAKIAGSEKDDVLKELLSTEREFIGSRKLSMTTEMNPVSKLSSSSRDTNPNLIHELIQSVKQKLNNEGDTDEEKLPESYHLKNIRSIITPELLYNLAKAGEDDTIVLASNSFPSSSLADRSDKLVRLDALCIKTVLKEIMKLISVSKTAQFPLLLMKPEEKEAKDPAIWTEFKEIVENADNQKYRWGKLKKQKFYEEAKKVILNTHSSLIAANRLNYNCKLFRPW